MKTQLFIAFVVAVIAPWSRGGEAGGFPKPAELPSQVSLPDPLVMLDGRKVTTREMWMKERRPELIRLFQHYMYGQFPAKPVVVSKVERVDAASFGGKATLSEVTLKFGPPETPPIHLLLIVPNRRTAPAPVVLALNYFGNHTLVPDKNVRLPDNWMPGWGGEGAWSAKVVGNRATEGGRGSWLKFWPIEDLLDRGYALATFYNGDIDPDTPDQRGLQKFFKQNDPADDVGSIGAWAWGLQRAVDYLVTAPDVDPRRIITTGHSRTGKAALIAAAFDERIALTIPHQAGCGGTAPSRARIAIGKPYDTLDTPQTKPPETVANINDKFPHWFNARFKEFNAQPERLPFDQNCLVALCAPRPVLFSNGRADTWINPAGQFEVLRATAPVYRLLGAGDFTAEDLPPDRQLIGGVLGYYLRPGAHSLLREDWKVFLDYADKHLGTPVRDKPAARSEEKAVVPAGGERSGTGPITIDPDFPHSFRYQSGQRFFPMGDTAYFLIAQPNNVIAHYIDVRRAHKFNFIRMMAMADGFWPFGGTPGKPQYTVINETAMRKWDWVFDYAAGRGMNIELIIWGYGVGGGEGLWASQANQDFWIGTLVNRYKGRPNLFMYTIANEFERYPDGKYQYAPADVEWARGVAARIRELDPIHPIGCHPSVWITDHDAPNQGPRPFATYKGFTQRPPQVVWPLWEGSAVNLNVTQNNEGVQPRTWGNIEGSRRGLTYSSTNYQGTDYPATWTATGWEFEAAGLQDCLAEDWAHGKPVLNTEFGYQHEPGYESEMNHVTHQCHQPSTLRKKAWKIATSGAYFAAGFECTAVRNFTEGDADNFRPAQLEVLYDFFAKTEYWKMAPHPEGVAAHNVLLALPGKEYVAYFPRGGTNSVKLVSGTYAAEWLHPETGRYSRQPDLTVTGDSRELIPPDHPNDDWVLHLSRDSRQALLLPKGTLAAAVEAPTYTNPIGGEIRMGDPFVLRLDGKYFLYGTTANDGFKCWASTDLVNWEALGYAYRRDEQSWGQKLFWAPEVVRYRGRFYLVYSCQGRDREAGFRLCLAVSDRPEGPFKDVHAPWLDLGWSCIDADLFVDDDGTPYLFFNKVGVVREPEWHMYGMIYAVRLSEDLSKAATQPVLCARADQAWEEMDPKHRSRCNEGAFVFKQKGTYYMTYSSGHYLSPKYGIGWATARSPLGPWTKSGDNPLLAGDARSGVSGPGHSCMTWSPDGKEMFIVYHAHADANAPGAGRTVNIDRVLVDDEGRLKVRGPTRTPQTRPSGPWRKERE